MAAGSSHCKAIYTAYSKIQYSLFSSKHVWIHLHMATQLFSLVNIAT